MTLEQRLTELESERLSLIADGFNLLTNPRIGELAKKAFHVSRLIKINDASMKELVKMVSDWTYHGDTEYINLAKDEQNRRLKEMTPKELYEFACDAHISLTNQIIAECLSRD